MGIFMCKNRTLLGALSFSIILAGLIFLTPASAPGADPQASPAEILALDNAQKTFEKGDFDNAILQLKDFLSKYPNSLKADQAYFILGESQVNQHHLPEAREAYKQIIDQFHSSSYYPQAYSRLANITYDLGDLDQAKRLFEDLLEEAAEPQKQVELYDKLIDIGIRKEAWNGAIDDLLERGKLLTGGADQENSKNKVIELVQTKLSKKNLWDLIEKYPQSFPGDFAYVRLVSVYETEKDTFHLEKTIKHFLEAFPRNGNGEVFKIKIGTINDLAKKHKINIGVVVPSLQKASEVVDQVVNGVNLALWDYQKTTHDESVGLIFKELGSQSEKNRPEVESFIKEFSPKAIIGPLFSKEFESMAGLADSYSIPFMTPTATHPGITLKSKFLFRNALTNGTQAREIADYAVAQGHLKRFVILYPKNSYGEEASKAFFDEVIRLGGEVIFMDSYPPETTDFSPQIKQLIKVDLTKYGVEGEIAEEKDYKHKVKREYTPGFDSVFLPGEGEKGGLIPSQLAFYDIQGVVLLGTNGWNSTDFLRAGGKYVEGGVFVDGFFIGSTAPLAAEFVSRYRKTFQSDPSIFSAQSYDAMQMILQSVKGGASTGSQIKSAILEIKSFDGVSGTTRFRPDGEAEKKVFILQIKNGRFTQVNQP